MAVGSPARRVVPLGSDPGRRPLGAAGTLHGLPSVPWAPPEGGLVPPGAQVTDAGRAPGLRGAGVVLGESSLRVGSTQREAVGPRGRGGAGGSVQGSRSLSQDWSAGIPPPPPGAGLAGRSPGPLVTNLFHPLLTRQLIASGDRSIDGSRAPGLSQAAPRPAQQTPMAQTLLLGWGAGGRGGKGLPRFPSWGTPWIPARPPPGEPAEQLTLGALALCAYVQSLNSLYGERSSRLPPPRGSPAEVMRVVRAAAPCKSQLWEPGRFLRLRLAAPICEMGPVPVARAWGAGKTEPGKGLWAAPGAGTPWERGSRARRCRAVADRQVDAQMLLGAAPSAGLGAKPHPHGLGLGWREARCPARRPLLPQRAVDSPAPSWRLIAPVAAISADGPAPRSAETGGVGGF